MTRVFDGCCDPYVSVALVKTNAFPAGLRCAIVYQPYSAEPPKTKERCLSYVTITVEGCVVQTIQGGQSFDETVRSTNWPGYIESARRYGWFDRDKILADKSLEESRHAEAMAVLTRRLDLAS